MSEDASDADASSHTQELQTYTVLPVTHPHPHQSGKKPQTPSIPDDSVMDLTEDGEDEPEIDDDDDVSSEVSAGEDLKVTFLLLRKCGITPISFKIIWSCRRI